MLHINLLLLMVMAVCYPQATVIESSFACGSAVLKPVAILKIDYRETSNLLKHVGYLGPK